MAGEGGKEPSEPDAGVQVEEDELKVEKIVLDDLDQKLSKAFSGRVVRKDLVKKLKIGFNIPVYVLEYLLGKYCSTTNETEIIVGLEMVKSAIRERIVRGDETELVKARLAEDRLTQAHRPCHGETGREGSGRQVLGEAGNGRARTWSTSTTRLSTNMSDS